MLTESFWGLLRVKGTIDIRQFWPTGQKGNILSDADTVHVHVDPATAFVFEGNVTRAFDYAWIKTRKNMKNKAWDGSYSPIYVIVSQTTDPHIKIRLQGIDAPEPHCHVDQKKPEVRRNWGKRATFDLRKKLDPLASGTKVDCHVETLVKSPADVFDAYGRFMGDIIIADGNRIVNINHWLVENGWAFPAHYNSAKVGEITAINALWTSGKTGIRKSISNRATNDMYGLPAGNAGDDPAEATQDKGQVVFLKLLRHLVALRENPLGTNTLMAFEAVPKNKKDKVIRLDVFKALTPSQRAHPEKNKAALIELHSLITDGNRLDPDPTTLVFLEKPAVLKNSNGKVTSWDEQGVSVTNIPKLRPSFSTRSLEHPHTTFWQNCQPSSVQFGSVESNRGSAP